MYRRGIETTEGLEFVNNLKTYAKLAFKLQVFWLDFGGGWLHVYVCY